MTIYVALNDLMCFISHGPLSILRGAGRMTFAAIATLIPFNLISLPLAAYLMYVRHWRLSGYWIALAIGAFIQMIMLLLYIFRLSYEDMIKSPVEISKKMEIYIRRTMDL